MPKNNFSAPFGKHTGCESYLAVFENDRELKLPTNSRVMVTYDLPVGAHKEGVELVVEKPNPNPKYTTPITSEIRTFHGDVYVTQGKMQSAPIQDPKLTKALLHVGNSAYGDRKLSVEEAAAVASLVEAICTAYNEGNSITGGEAASLTTQANRIAQKQRKAR